MNERQQNHPPSNTSSPLFLEDAIDFKKILERLYYKKWVILAAGFSVCFIVFIYTFTIPPRYQTSALLQIQPQSSGPDFQPQSSGKISAQSSPNSNLVTQQALIKTRYILEPVIVQTGLNVSTGLSYFPIFGKWMAQRYSGEGVAKPFMGLKSYAWGGEKINVKKFSVPNYFIGQSFNLVAEKNQAYKLFLPTGELVLTGKVGELATSDKYDVKLELTELKARPDTPFAISYNSPIGVVAGVSNNIKISDIYGNDPSQSTGIFQLSMSGDNPKRIINLLNSIINYAVIKNKEQNEKETQKTLNFVTEQLPELKSKLKVAENKINQYHIQHNVLSMSMISQYLIQQLNAIEFNIDKLQSQRKSLLQLYTPQHPMVIENIKREMELKKHLEGIKKQIKEFPIINQQENDLQREAKVKNSMYLNMLSGEQQLEITKAGLESNIIILSDAVPASKIPSHKKLLIIMGFFMGVFFSIISILIHDALNKSVEDSDQLEDEFKIPVQCVLPYSRKQKQMERAGKKGLSALGTGLATPIILAKQAPSDITIESLRSLRISLQLMSSSASPVIAIMGSLANIGKSFVSLNLAQVISDSGKRTLIIDGDIRRGLMHRSLRQPKSNGLGEYLEGKCRYEGLVRHIHNNLFYISCGQFMTHPLQLFQSSRLFDLIEKIKQDFEQVIIDTPPILPVSDSILIAKHCDIRLFVVSAGKDTIGDVKQALKKSRTHNIKIDGIVLNHQKSLHNARYEYRYAYEPTHAQTLA